MKYNSINYLIVEGFRNVLKNKKSTVSCLIVMCATMLIFGIFLAIGENINHIMKKVKEEQGMEVFIKSDASEEDIKELGRQIRSLDGVNTAEYFTSEQAFEKMKKKFVDNQKLLEESDIVFPASYVVKVTDLTLSTQVNEQIMQLEFVDEIKSSDETVSKLITIANGIKMFTFIILLILIVVSVFIISNTIKLTVHARRKEISIMKYVGATNGFIRIPFVVEGILIGIFASLFSIVIVGGGYNVLATKVASSMAKTINVSLVSFADMLNLIIIVYLLLGIGIGVVGSIISMKKYLEV